MSISESFFTVCNDAQPAGSFFVSLYRSVQFYGGPEEGGWWGTDIELVAYKEFQTQETADAAVERITEMADKLTDEAKREDCIAMAASCDWLDARGLDADFLPEPDGPDRYWVAVESKPGSRVSEGDRHYS